VPVRGDRERQQSHDERREKERRPRPGVPLARFPPLRQVVDEAVELGKGLRGVAALEPIFELRRVETALLVRAPELRRDGLAIRIAGTKKLAH